jgi:hypothetical protein
MALRSLSVPAWVCCVCGGMGEWRTDESGGRREWWSEGVVVTRSGGRREWWSEGVVVGKEWWSQGVVVIGSGG